MHEPLAREKDKLALDPSRLATVDSGVLEKPRVQR